MLLDMTTGTYRNSELMNCLIADAAIRCAVHELTLRGRGRNRLSYSFLGPSVMDGLPSGSRDVPFGGGVRIEKPLVALRTERENDRPCQLCMT